MEKLKHSELIRYIGFLVVGVFIGVLITLNPPFKLMRKERMDNSENWRQESKHVVRDKKVPNLTGKEESLAWPIEGGKGEITQCSQWYHKAIDIADKSAPLILAADAGKVIKAGLYDKYGYGNEVVIDHGDGLFTAYAHLDRVDVKVGDEVKRLAVIGKMGNTGYATGTFVHFEVRLNGGEMENRIVNPQYYLEGSECEVVK